MVIVPSLNGLQTTSFYGSKIACVVRGHLKHFVANRAIRHLLAYGFSHFTDKCGDQPGVPIRTAIWVNQATKA